MGTEKHFHWLLLLGVFSFGACSTDDGPTSPITPLAVGQSHAGGVIFYLDETGEHGLAAAPIDQGSTVGWFNGEYVVTGATGIGIGTGQANTSAIVNAQGEGNYAASLCDQLVLNGFDDWFLPSKNELDALYLSKAVVSGFSEDFYWSSTEHGEGSAWEQVFNTGAQYNANKNFHIRVRAVRAF
jgi:hypothetical protein